VRQHRDELALQLMHTQGCSNLVSNVVRFLGPEPHTHNNMPIKMTNSAAWDGQHGHNKANGTHKNAVSGTSQGNCWWTVCGTFDTVCTSGRVSVVYVHTAEGLQHCSRHLLT